MLHCTFKKKQQKTKTDFKDVFLKIFNIQQLLFVVINMDPEAKYMLTYIHSK